MEEVNLLRHENFCWSLGCGLRRGHLSGPEEEAKGESWEAGTQQVLGRACLGGGGSGCSQGEADLGEAGGWGTAESLPQGPIWPFL